MKHLVTSASSLTFFSSRKLSAKSILVACVSKSSSRLSLSLFCHEAFFSIDKVGLHRGTLSSFFHLSTFKKHVFVPLFLGVTVSARRLVRNTKLPAGDFFFYEEELSWSMLFSRSVIAFSCSCPLVRWRSGWRFPSHICILRPNGNGEAFVICFSPIDGLNFTVVVVRQKVRLSSNPPHPSVHFSQHHQFLRDENEAASV